MKDILKENGWTCIGSNKSKTYFTATDKPFPDREIDLEVAVGKKVLINGLVFSDGLIPTTEEARRFHDEMCDN
jgi:hypothetical protein